VTTADIAVLSGEDRVTEIARMLGGDPESDVSRAHARELLETAGGAAAGELVVAESAPAKRTRRR
jgi:DNA repair protein RecN (Recombination protein N)